MIEGFTIMVGATLFILMIPMFYRIWVGRLGVLGVLM